MRQIIRQSIVFFAAVFLLTSCRGGIPLLSKRVDQSAFHVADANIAEKGEAAAPALVPVEMVRVGLLVPLTGSSAKLGEVLRNAAMMSLFDISSQRLILQFYDTQGTAEGAREAAELAISQGVELIIGPVFSKSVRAIRPATHSADVGVITFSSDPSNLGDGIYTISTLTSQQVEHIVRYACDKGYKRLAVLSQDNATGDIISMAAKAAVDSCGGMITKAAFYDPQAADLQSAVQLIMPRLMEDLEAEREEEVKRLEKSKELVRDPFEFDAVLISEEGSRLRSLGALFSYYDVPSDIRILGTSQWADSRPAREPALIGGWFSHLPSEGFAAFSQRYKDIYGEKPPRIASQAYDAVALAAILAETGSFSYENLTTVSGFKGVDGLFRLLPNGLSERGLQVLGVEKKGFVTLSPALEVFETVPVFVPDVYIKDFRHSPDLVTIPLTPEEAAAQGSMDISEMGSNQTELSHQGSAQGVQNH